MEQATKGFGKSNAEAARESLKSAALVMVGGSEPGEEGLLGKKFVARFESGAEWEELRPPAPSTACRPRQGMLPKTRRSSSSSCSRIRMEMCRTSMSRASGKASSLTASLAVVSTPSAPALRASRITRFTSSWV